MHWNENKTLTVECSSESFNGSWCVFVPLSATEGVKFYHDPEIRDRAAELQRIAHSEGYGPAVGEFCTMPRLHSWHQPSRWPEETRTVYGYVTEIAEDVGKIAYHSEEFEELRNRIDEAGYDSSDVHECNVGRIDGKIVCIDFDPAFFGYDSDIYEKHPPQD